MLSQLPWKIPSKEMTVEKLTINQEITSFIKK